jgi:hypothetical protein
MLTNGKSSIKKRGRWFKKSKESPCRKGIENEKLRILALIAHIPIRTSINNRLSRMKGKRAI